MWCIRWTSRRRWVRSGCARSWPSWSTVRQWWCSGTAARSAVSPATASWRCSARRWRWRTTLFAPAWRRLGIQEEAKRLAVDVRERDGVELQLRVGLNSGQVIAGEIGSGPFGYTAIGEQVGMAQRMESVAPPGGVMLSASTARLVDGAAALGEPEMVQIKGADEPVARPSAVGHGRTASRCRACRVESGRSAVGDVRRRGLVGPCDRRPRRCGRRGRAAWHRQEPSGARGCGDGSCAVVSRCSPPSASRTPARSPSMPWRGCCARPPASRVSTRRPPAIECATGFPTQTRRTCCCLMTCWASPIPMLPLPQIDPDARRRRLTALVNAASLARETPGGLCRRGRPLDR